MLKSDAIYNIINKSKTWQQAAVDLKGKFTGTAIICKDKRISFSEFDRITDHIASALGKKCIGPGSVVALQMSRTEKMVLAMFGIIKSGAALLPLPEEMPKKHRDEIFSLVRTDFTISDETYESLISDKTGIHSVKIASPEDLALILFTSGSSGTPKGVCHTQAANAELIKTFIGNPANGLNKKIKYSIGKTSINHVSAFLVDYAAFFYGKTLIMLDEEERNSPSFFSSVLRHYKNCLYFITPSQLSSFLQEADFPGTNPMFVMVGGEMLTDAARELAVRRFSADSTLCGLYGSTECYFLTKLDLREPGNGYSEAFDGIDIRIIGDNDRVCKPYESGEICVSSAELSNEYLGANTRTILIDGKEFFRTGDRGACDESGRIAVLGRIDRMIKYHGLRIEPAEIENAICRFKGIEKAAVVETFTSSGVKLLCAYYEGSVTADRKELRRFLSDYLPVSMIPAGMCRLDHLPMNQNGKIDYMALTQRKYTAEDAADVNISDTSEEEKLIIDLAGRILDQELNNNSNLIELGMDSLNAFRLISGLRTRGYKITLDEIFDNAVVSRLASALTKIDKTEASVISCEGKSYPATSIQQYWGTDISVFKKMSGLYITDAFITSQVYDEKGFNERVQLIVKRHPALRTSFSMEDGVCRQSISEDPVQHQILFYGIRDLGGGDDPFALSGSQAAFIGNQRSKNIQSLNTASKPVLFQAAYFDISPKSGVIVFTCSHAVSDGASMNILRSEFLAEDLDDTEDGYVRYLDHIAQKDNLEIAEAFWKNYLTSSGSSALPKAAVPIGRPDFRSFNIFLDRSETDRLTSRCLKEGVSPVGYIMYAYGNAILKTLGKSSALMQILTFGRGIDCAGMDETVGCMIQYVPVVIDSSYSPTDFQKGYLQAERFSYYPTGSILPKTEFAPFLISEVFPEMKTEAFFRELDRKNYDKMVISSFIAKEDGKLNVYLHYDASKTDSDSFVSMASEMEKQIRAYAKPSQSKTLQNLVADSLCRFSGTAVECEGRTVSYEELDWSTSQIAAYFSSRGIGPGSKVILCMKRSEKLVSAMFGIFKSGAAMVPVSCDIPNARLKTVETECQAKILLDEVLYDQILSENVVSNDADIAQAEENDTAVIIYTSGSTGKAKGVCHSQKAEYITFTQYPDELGSIGMDAARFDTVISRTEAFYNLSYHCDFPTAVLTGKKLVLLSEKEKNSIRKTAQIISSNPNASMSFTPSLLEGCLADEEFCRSIAGLSVIVLAGEKVSEQLKKRLTDLLPDTLLLDLYGSTECQGICWSDLRDDAPGGRPLPGTIIAAFDGDKLLPPGKEGELCVCSPAATDSFVSGKQPGFVVFDNRKYLRSGDLGYISSDNRVVCLGRTDRMIKFHGQRIAPEEIERHINEISGISDSAVIFAGAPDGRKYIKAFFRSSAEVDASKLRNVLASKLPSYMIPAVFERIDHIPVNSSGKTDYRLLESISGVDNALTDKQAKDDMSEKELCISAAAGKILGIDPARISSSDNLLSIGIDSIKALMLFSELENRGYAVSMDEFLKHPSVTELAEAVKKTEKCDNNYDEDREYYVSALQNYWAASQEAGDRVNGLYILKCYVADRVYTEDEMNSRLECIIDRHPALRTVYTRISDHNYVQTIKKTGLVNWENKDVRNLGDGSGVISMRQDNFIKMYAMRVWRRYTEGKNAENAAFHVSCVRVSDDRSVFILLLNHTCADGMTEKILLRELLNKSISKDEDCYREYLDYIGNENNRKAAEGFWKQYLGNAAPSCLPLNRSFSGIPRVETYSVCLDTKDTERFKQVCLQNNVSLPVMVTYLYGQTLLEILGEDSAVFRMLFYGRNIPVSGIENMAGCVIDRLPVVIRKSDSVRDFRSSCFAAGRYGFLSDKEIFSAAWGKPVVPLLAPAIVSVIGQTDSECFCSEYNPPDYTTLLNENFLVEDVSGLKLIFHFDADLFEVESFKELADKIHASMLELLKERATDEDNN